MKKIKIDADSFVAELLKEFFRKIRDSNRIANGLEVEHLVLIEFDRKNAHKLQFESTFKIKMLPHEAISLYRMLFGLGLKDPMAATKRDEICQQIHQQLPPIQSRIQQN